MGHIFKKPKKPKFQPPPPQPKPPSPVIMSKKVTKEDASMIGNEVTDTERKRRLLSSMDNSNTGAGLGGNTSSGTGGKRKLLG